MTTLALSTWHDLGDGRKVARLEQERWDELKLDLRRYFRWADSGRQLDPWQSGVASSSRYDKIQSKHHKPSSGYDAGHCAEPEQDPRLVELDAVIQSLRDNERNLLRWRLMERATIAMCAERFDESSDSTERRYQRLKVMLWYHLR